MATKNTKPNKTRTKNTENDKENEEEVKLKKIYTIIAIVASIVLLMFITIICVILANEDARERQKIYDISVDTATDEACSNVASLNECTGTITVTANLSEDGKISDITRGVSSNTEGGELFNDTNSTEDIFFEPQQGIVTIKGNSFSEDKYLDLIKSGKYEKEIRVVALKSKKTSEKRATYKLKVIYIFSDADKNVLSSLEQKRQERIAEQQRQKEAAEAEAARRKLANTPFTYSSSKCGFQGDVFCLLVSDFVADDLWKDRTRATFSDFINKTSAVTPTRHLIYIFRDAGCYNEKINSKGLSVCDVAGGEIAVSQDTDGITWSYEK